MPSAVEVALDYLTKHFIETSACGVVALCLLGFLWWWHQYRILHGKDPKMSPDELLAWDTRTDEERQRERSARRRQARIEMEYFEKGRVGRSPSAQPGGPPWPSSPPPPAEDLVKSADTREELRTRNPLPRRDPSESPDEPGAPPMRRRRVRPKRP